MDKVKLHAQERLDLDDTRALQSLVYDYVSEALGGLMGHAHGVLSVPEVYTTENSGAPYIYLRPFTFVTTTPMETGSTGQPLSDSVTGGTAYKQFKSIVVNYDPNEEAAQTIDIDGFRANFDSLVSSFGPQYLWAQPISVNTDTATRRKWDVTSGAEVTFSDHTRESQRVSFVIQNAEPPYAVGEARWARVAQITGFTDGDNAGSTPQITWFSVFDDFAINEQLNTTDAKVGMYRLLSDSLYPFVFDSQQKSHRSFGLPFLLTAIKRQIALITGLVNWTNEPTGLDLTTANSRLFALESRQLSPAQCIASCTVTVDIDDLATQRFSATWSGNSHGFDRTATSLIRNAGYEQQRVYLKMQDSVLDQGWAITHVSVAQVFLRAPSTAEPGHYDYNRVTFVVDPDVTATTDTSDASSLLLYGSSFSARGVKLQFLPHIIDESQAHTHGESIFHPPTGETSNSDCTVVLRDLVLEDHALIFTVAVFAVPVADADN